MHADVALRGDCGAVLGALLGKMATLPIDPSLSAPWRRTIAAWRAERCLVCSDRAPVIVPQRLMHALDAQLAGRDAIVSTDVGQHQMWAAQHLAFERPRRWLTAGGAGTMGYALPAAIGAQVAHPDDLVVCVSGDASMRRCVDASIMMNIRELATAMQHRCPIKVILSNKGCMGMVRQWQELHHAGRYSHSYAEAMPDFVALAHAFGWQARRVERMADLDEALATCLASTGPYFLDLAVTQAENCFPMIPPACGHHEILLAKERWYRAP